MLDPILLLYQGAEGKKIPWSCIGGLRAFSSLPSSITLFFFAIFFARSVLFWVALKRAGCCHSV